MHVADQGIGESLAKARGVQGLQKAEIRGQRLHLGIGHSTQAERGVQRPGHPLQLHPRIGMGPTPVEQAGDQRVRLQRLERGVQ